MDRSGFRLTYVQAGLALYWWQRLITFGIGRIRFKRKKNKKTQTRTLTFLSEVEKKLLFNKYVYIDTSSILNDGNEKAWDKRLKGGKYR